jgi:hypothetical protein
LQKQDSPADLTNYSMVALLGSFNNIERIFTLKRDSFSRKAGG